jgi:hypothetical protein
MTKQTHAKILNIQILNPVLLIEKYLTRLDKIDRMYSFWYNPSNRFGIGLNAEMLLL